MNTPMFTNMTEGAAGLLIFSKGICGLLWGLDILASDIPSYLYKPYCKRRVWKGVAWLLQYANTGPHASYSRPLHALLPSPSLQNLGTQLSYVVHGNNQISKNR